MAAFKTEFSSYCDFVAVRRVIKGEIAELVVRGVELLNTDTMKRKNQLRVFLTVS